MSQAKLLGLIIDQQMVGKPKEFNLTGDIAENRRALFEKLVERVGERSAKQMLALMKLAV